MHSKIKAIIDHYQFDKIPIEGTLYKSTYVADHTYKNAPIGTAIIGFYAHQPYSVSTFHRLTQDEVWHYYDGDPFILHLLFPDGRYQKVIMGRNFLKGQKIQFVIPANVWQAGELVQDGEYALYGCTLAPGFTGPCFEGGVRKTLLANYPNQASIIQRLSVESHETKLPKGFEQ